MPGITPLPTPVPQTSDPTNFDARGDAFLAALPTFGVEATALQADVTTRQADVTAKQALTTAAAATATAAATSATNAATTFGTSVTNMTVGTGAKTFGTDTGKSWKPGQGVCCSSTANAVNQMVGIVTAYDTVTGSMTATFTQTNGAGTFAAWTVTVAGYTLNAAGISSVQAAAASVTLANLGVHVACAMVALGQAITLPAATGLALGGPSVAIDNTKGAYTVGIRDSTGVLLMAVAAGGEALVSLKDNSTAAGQWGITGTLLEPGLVTIDNTFSTTFTSTAFTAYVALDNNTSVHFLALSSGFAAVIVDGLGKVVSTPVTVDAGASMVPKAAFKIDATHTVVFYSDGASSKAVVLTVSGASPALALAVGTAAALAGSALSASNVAGGTVNVAQLTASLYACAYAAGTALTAVAVSVAGTTVTVGAATASILTVPNVNAVLIFPLSATTALCLSKTGAGPYTTQAVVISIAGTVASAGAVVSTGVTSSVVSQSSSAVLLSPTLAVVLDDGNNSNVTAAAVSIAGAVVTAGATVVIEAIASTCYYTGSGASVSSPHLWAVSATSAGCWYMDSGSISRALVLSVAGVTITPGGINYRSISNGAANAAGNGFVLTPSSSEFCAIEQSLPNTAGYGLTLVPSKIAGAVITQGAARPMRDATPSAPANHYAGRLPGGDYALFNQNSNNPVLPVFRSNGDVINPRGEVSVPFVTGAGGPMPVVGNRVVLLGLNAQAPTAGLSTYQMRLINVEIAA